MVGRKTSPRCANCRQRKIKVETPKHKLHSVALFLANRSIPQCDLLRPSCSQCVKSKWTCPGYDSHARFFAYEKNSSGDSAATSTSGDTSDCNGASTQTRKRNRTLSLHVNPISGADTLRNKLVFRITHRAVAARFVVLPEHQLLQHIPRRLGHNRALDDAVQCICTTPSRSTPETTPAIPEKQYGEALHSLQRALGNSNVASASETLGAAILLQMFEHSVDHSEFRWVVHA